MDFLYDIHKTKGLKRFDTDTLEEMEAIKLTQKLNLDCDDAIQYYICKTYNFKIGIQRFTIICCEYCIRSSFTYWFIIPKELPNY